MIQRIKATIHGIVQGIGFRPFVYQLAQKHHLKGYILNNSQGVELEIEGCSSIIDLFFKEIEDNHPPLARIVSIQKKILPISGYQDFSIRKSIAQSEKAALIAPDVCVCEACLSEMYDPENRRYRYPFINCTNCGPRYTIIQDVPYDRPNTTMSNFQMCPDCEREYHDPANRRFHAQPNACAVCGPQVQLYDQQQNLVQCADPILKAIEFLKNGSIVAIKGLGGFHLAVDASNSQAVQILRLRKQREEKPLALMSLNLELIKQFTLLSENEISLLTSPQRPIVLLKKKSPNAIAMEVAPQNHYFGVMLPYTPLHFLLLQGDFLALVMTSGNLSDEPIVIDNVNAFNMLGKIADYFLVHNRDIYLRSDDSILRQINQSPLFIRRSRGYVPQPILLNRNFPSILAVGAELKNTICLTRKNQSFLSQHIGDLKNFESYQCLHLTVSHLKRILDIQPEIIAYDFHPDYLSTHYAQEQNSAQKIRIQHHHAHIASCVLEHGLEGPVIGLAFDGTGLGTDGKIWGGEILLVEQAACNRLAHLRYFPLPGGDAAIQEPWRMAVSYLYQAFGDDFFNFNFPFFKEIGEEKIQFIIKMIKQDFNCPRTSSLGRLFEGVAALLGLCNRNTYEGQAAISLEMAIEKSNLNQLYPYDWEQEDEGYIILISPIIWGIVSDLMKKESIGTISFKFHLTLIQLFSDLCQRLKRETKLKRVVLSGGVFQNFTLLTGLQKSLQAGGFEVYSHSKVPPNDGGIALGQAGIAGWLS
ncbi:carbamoyltransferase HypF [candidate division KSB1 bacterium]|nr:carbamoyltransferase HypF [candidate division KSB1 bacterium]